MNKLVLAGVSVLAINFLSSAAFAEDKMEMDKKDAKVETTTEAAKPAAECPPKKKHKRVHHKHKHHKHHKGALWVNAEEPCAVPAPCAPVCPPAPCAPVCAPEPVCAPVCAPEPTCAPEPVCAPACPPEPVCAPTPAPACEPLPPTCTPQCFGGVTSYPYIAHGGYFYYPNAQGTMVAGYNPTYMNGAYWYASRQHPYDVYAERRPVLYVMPHGMHTPHAMQHHAHAHKMHKAAAKVKADKAATK